MTEWESVLRLWPEEGLAGRRKVLTDKKEITDANVVEVLGKALAVHHMNCREIDYLERYYRGIQDIRCRTKTIRPEINNKITVNIANEIVTFKTAFFMGSPMQYVAAGGDDGVSEQVRLLNEFMRAEDRDSKDKEICDWFHICGVSERLVLPDPAGEGNECPFLIYTLHPCEAFVIYYSGIGQKPLAGVIIQKDEEGQTIYCVYTDNRYYEIQGDTITKNEGHTLGGVPLVEYLNNEARMGAFEVVLPLLNAINTLESNRVDDIEQFVQSILVFKNCEIDEEKAKQLKQQLGLMIKDNGQQQSDVFRVDGELSQAGAQTVKDDMYESILTICGMPNRNGGSSTSDTGTAVLYRDGYAQAESRANDTEKMFNRADRRFLQIVFNICEATGALNLRMANVKQEHARNNLSNMQSRMQVLCEGLNNPKIHPKLPWQFAGLPNAEENYRISMEFYKEQQQKAAEMFQQNQPQESGEEQPAGEQHEKQEQTA